MSMEITTVQKEKAIQVHERICMYAQRAQEDIYHMGKAMNQMNEERLYRPMGYDTFEDYCFEKFALKKSQAYKYISIYKNLGEDFMTENPGLGLSKTYLLSQLTEDERTEVIESSDVNEASVAELKAQIEKMKEDNEKRQCSFFEEEKKKDLAISKAISEVDKLKAQVKEADKLHAKNAELQKRIKELEDKPVDVAICDPDPLELESRAEEIANEKIAEIQKQAKEDEKALKDKYKDYDNMINEYAKRLSDKDKEIDNIKAGFDKKLENILQASKETSETENSTQVETPDPSLSAKEQFKVYLKNAITLINQSIEFAQTTDQADFLISQLKTAIQKIGDKL